MLQYLLKISTNVFCHCCPRREGVRRGAVLSSRCLASWPSPSTTVDRKRTSKRRHHVWSVERFALSFSFSFLRSVHGCMGMDVWVNVFTMPFLCADPGPWRRMGRAWPATSAKTTSATTCHQDSAWRGAESRQDRVIVEVVRKAIVVGKCCSMCRTHLQMFSVSTERRPPTWCIPEGHLPRTVAQRHTAQKRITERRRMGMLFVLVVCMGGWEWTCEWIFTMPFLRADSGPWRQMKAWPQCPRFRLHVPSRQCGEHQAVYGNGCVLQWMSLLSYHAVLVPSPSTTVDRKRTVKASSLVSWAFLRSVHGCMGMDVWVNVFTMPFLCADPRPWRRMGRAWPATSAKTTSAPTCHQDSAWWGAESRQDRVIVEVVRKAIVAGKCCSMCRTHLQKLCSCMWTWMMLSIGWEGCMCEITQFIAVADVDMPFDKCIL